MNVAELRRRIEELQKRLFEYIEKKNGAEPSGARQGDSVMAPREKNKVLHQRVYRPVGTRWSNVSSTIARSSCTV